MNKQAWKSNVLVSRETYDYLAENLEEDSDEPEKATVLAGKACATRVKTICGKTHKKKTS